MTGSISDVISASTLRLLRRKHRAAIAGKATSQADDRGSVLPPRTSIAMLDTDGLLVGRLGQGEEHVVEGRASHGETSDRLASGIERIEQVAHLGRGAIRCDRDR